jgi:signal transduction histidine kinase
MHKRPESEVLLRAQELQRLNKELMQAKKALEEANEAKTQWFANVSHELRTPLALILGPAEKIISQGLNLTDTQKRDLEVICRNGRILLKRVNDLLAISKLDSGKMTLNYARWDLAALVRLIAGNFEAIAPQRGIRYRIDAPSTLEADIDAEKMERIVLNLLSNAFKFVPTGGSVECNLTSDPSGHALLSVVNTGEGVPAELREAIFERFRQGDSTRSRPFGGTGLGLAIVKEFVNLHRGEITVADALGGGVSFNVRIPLRAPEEVRAPLQKEVVWETVNAVMKGTLEELECASIVETYKSDSPDRAVVLVVEDNIDMRRFVTESIASEFRVITAANGREGLERLADGRPDLIISDMMMPEMTGDEMIRAIRSNHELDDIPILVLSGKADDALRVRVLREGAQDYVTKPFAAEELLVRARNLVAMKTAKNILQKELATKTQNLESLAREMSVRKRELEISNRLKDEFVQTVSHELRTPLTSICGWAALLRSSGLDAANRIRALEAIERNSKIQLTLVDDLLDMSRLITGKLNLDIQQVDLAALIEEVVESLRIAAEAKQLGIALELERTAGPIFGDANRLRQIVLNLLNNAIKFTPSHGEVSVTLRRVDSHVELVVSDTGQGIRADFLPQIFERFRSDVSTDRKHGGLGIGLAIVKSLVELHGGSVTAVSEGPGKGATFMVCLPMLVVRGNARQAAERLNKMPGGVDDLEGLRVVIVEDDPDTLALLTVILEGSGADVRSCVNSYEVIETFSRWHPHLLLCDVGLPGKDGYSLIAELLRMEPGLKKEMVAVALTAYASAADRKRALDCGFNAHLAKPVDPAELVGVALRLTEGIREKP